MKHTGLLLLGMLVAMPLAAQEAEDPAAAFADSFEAAPADEAAADAFADSAAAGSGDSAAEAPAAEVFTEDAAAPEAAGGDPFADGSTAQVQGGDPFADGSTTQVQGGDPFADGSTAEAPADSSFESTSPTDAGFAGAAAEESAPSEAATSEAASDPVWLYVGADYASLTASFSRDALVTQFGGDDFESSFYRVRVGTRLFDGIGVEGHFGVSDTDDSEPGDVEVSEYFGVFVVPTGVIFDLIEVAAPVGFSVTELSGRGAKKKFDGVSFGLNFEIPLLVDVEGFPDIRIGGGGTVYQAERDARIYGYHAGVRIDFNIF